MHYTCGPGGLRLSRSALKRHRREQYVVCWMFQIYFHSHVVVCL